jgi:hypothetical protein
MEWEDVGYGQRRGCRPSVGRQVQNKIYFGRHTKTKVIDKAYLSFEKALAEKLGWKHHDLVHFQVAKGHQSIRLVRHKDLGNQLQLPDKNSRSRARICIPVRLIEVLLAWFPSFKTDPSFPSNLLCEIVVNIDRHEMICSGFQLDK